MVGINLILAMWTTKVSSSQSILCQGLVWFVPGHLHAGTKWFQCDWVWQTWEQIFLYNWSVQILWEVIPTTSMIHCDPLWFTLFSQLHQNSTILFRICTLLLRTLWINLDCFLVKRATVVTQDFGNKYWIYHWQNDTCMQFVSFCRVNLKESANFPFAGRYEYDQSFQGHH